MLRRLIPAYFLGRNAGLDDHELPRACATATAWPLSANASGPSVTPGGPGSQYESPVSPVGFVTVG